MEKSTQIHLQYLMKFVVKLEKKNNDLQNQLDELKEKIHTFALNKLCKKQKYNAFINTQVSTQYHEKSRMRSGKMSRNETNNQLICQSLLNSDTWRVNDSKTNIICFLGPIPSNIKLQMKVGIVFNERNLFFLN